MPKDAKTAAAEMLDEAKKIEMNDQPLPQSNLIYLY